MHKNLFMGSIADGIHGLQVTLEIKKKTQGRKQERREIGKTLPHGDREGKQWGCKTNVFCLVSLPVQQVVIMKMVRLMMTFMMLFPSKNSTFHQDPLKCPVSPHILMTLSTA